MEWYNIITRLIHVNIIQCLPFSLVLLVLIRFFFERNFNFEWIFNVIKWIILIYSGVLLIVGLIVNFLDFESLKNVIKSSEGNSFYWTLAVLWGPLLLALTLLYDRLGRSPMYLFLTSFLLSLGAFFELYIILFTSIQRASSFSDYNLKSISILANGLMIIIIQSAIIGFLLLLSSKFLKPILERKNLFGF